MPQFDLLSLGAQITGLLVSITMLYFYGMNKTLVMFSEIKKFRSKKLVRLGGEISQINQSIKSILKANFKKYIKFMNE